MNREASQKILENNRKSYDQMAREFSASRGKFWEELAYLAERATPGMRVLDIGCGNGRFFPLIKARGADYTGVDNSTGLLAEARRAFTDGNFIESDATALPFPGSSFDIAYSFAVLHHVPSAALRKKFIQEAARMLNPDSLLILTVWQLWTPRHLGTLLRDAIKSVLGLAPLDAGDTMLTFGKNKTPRYLHAFTTRELTRLLERNGFSMVELNTIARKSGEKNIVVIARKN